MDLPIFYSEEDEWKKVMLMYDSALKEVNTKLEILNNEFKLNHQYNPIEHITSRIKTPQSIAKKLRHNNKELTVENIVKYINDVAGMRIICSFTSDIYRIADLIAAQSDVNVLKVKDYITCPKPNGYTSYHMIISVPIYLSEMMVNVKVEIQIRTIAMDFWASLEHKIYYKFEGNAPESIRKELKECAEIVSFLDHKMLSLNEEIRLYNPESEIEHYREVVSESFQSMIRESYGTVIDEEDINQEEDEEKSSQEARQEMYEDLFENTKAEQPDSLEDVLERVEEAKEKNKFFRFFKHNVMNEEMDKM
ncbi:putative GTP pyrophosphokinase [Anaerocolumna xylanovorans DSM 12503]|uniref:Putative GTP pyrophosphokinase n=1 Tax=Anaerocolumna xylanovorans DSM 12503 TaxID=1121345 RepID=A0A1M7YMY3_9FIRM|nr:GTP pyrophosphokinase family protein [Anaerocolumna xylanovorans]SHO53906.1 putative GTP pyrophosphokinase [Anaerocolumna xylanovorans DSM 12503]